MQTCISFAQPLQIHEEHPDNIEALSYLESMCRDMGRNYEEYSRKLEKLRRSQPAAANTQQAAGPYSCITQLAHFSPTVAMKVSMKTIANFVCGVCCTISCT
jgi:hypothetical protein